MEEFAKVLSTIGLSSVKHFFGGVAAAGYGYGFLEAVLYTAIGGLLGVLFFIFLSQSLQHFWRYLFPNRKPKRKFSRMSRFVVKVKQRFGLAGIAFITPWILTVPVGTMISCGLYPNKTRVFTAHALSVVMWSFIGGGLAQPLAMLFH